MSVKKYLCVIMAIFFNNTPMEIDVPPEYQEPSIFDHMPPLTALPAISSRCSHEKEQRDNLAILEYLKGCHFSNIDKKREAYFEAFRDRFRPCSDPDKRMCPFCSYTHKRKNVMDHLQGHFDTSLYRCKECQRLMRRRSSHQKGCPKHTHTPQDI